jgi:hypothetical protein
VLARHTPSSCSCRWGRPVVYSVAPTPVFPLLFGLIPFASQEHRVSLSSTRLGWVSVVYNVTPSAGFCSYLACDASAHPSFWPTTPPTLLLACRVSWLHCATLASSSMTSAPMVHQQLQQPRGCQQWVGPSGHPAGSGLRRALYGPHLPGPAAPALAAPTTPLHGDSPAEAHRDLRASGRCWDPVLTAAARAAGPATMTCLEGPAGTRHPLWDPSSLQ